VGPRVRVAGVLIEGGKLLVLRVRNSVSPSSDRRWSLPGGGLELGESLEACLRREMKEETGLEITVGKLLYVCDRLLDEDHTVHMTFLVHRTSGQLTVGQEPEPHANEILGAARSRLQRLLTDAGYPSAYAGLSRIAVGPVRHCCTA